MDDPLRVRKSHRVANLPKHSEQGRQRVFLQRLPVFPPQVIQEVLQRPPLHKLHRVEELTFIICAHVIDRHDVWMRQPPEYKCLPPKPRCHLG